VKIFELIGRTLASMAFVLMFITNSLFFGYLGSVLHKLVFYDHPRVYSFEWSNEMWWFYSAGILVGLGIAYFAIPRDARLPFCVANLMYFTYILSRCFFSSWLIGLDFRALSELGIVTVIAFIVSFRMWKDRVSRKEGQSLESGKHS